MNKLYNPCYKPFDKTLSNFVLCQHLISWEDHFNEISNNVHPCIHISAIWRINLVNINYTQFRFCRNFNHCLPSALFVQSKLCKCHWLRCRCMSLWINWLPKTVKDFFLEKNFKGFAYSSICDINKKNSPHLLSMHSITITQTVCVYHYQESLSKFIYFFINKNKTLKKAQKTCSNVQKSQQNINFWQSNHLSYNASKYGQASINRSLGTFIINVQSNNDTSNHVSFLCNALFEHENHLPNKIMPTRIKPMLYKQAGLLLPRRGLEPGIFHLQKQGYVRNKV